MSANDDTPLPTKKSDGTLNGILWSNKTTLPPCQPDLERITFASYLFWKKDKKESANAEDKGGDTSKQGESKLGDLKEQKTSDQVQPQLASPTTPSSGDVKALEKSSTAASKAPTEETWVEPTPIPWSWDEGSKQTPSSPSAGQGPKETPPTADKGSKETPPPQSGEGSKETPPPSAGEGSKETPPPASAGAGPEAIPSSPQSADETSAPPESSPPPEKKSCTCKTDNDPYFFSPNPPRRSTKGLEDYGEEEDQFIVRRPCSSFQTRYSRCHQLWVSTCVPPNAKNVTDEERALWCKTCPPPPRPNNRQWMKEFEESREYERRLKVNELRGQQENEADKPRTDNRPGSPCTEGSFTPSCPQPSAPGACARPAKHDEPVYVI